MTDERPLRIVLMSSNDPLDPRSFSTTLVHMVGALRGEYPSLQVERQSRPRWYNLLRRRVRQATGKRLNPDYWGLLNRAFAARIVRRWRSERALMIAVVNSPITAEVARHMPTINVSDATFAVMRGYYPEFAGLAPHLADAADRAERQTIERSVHSSYSSRWAAASAIRDYGASPEDVSFIPWGCNLPTQEAAALPDVPEECRLLFDGVDRTRKGGDVLLDAVRLLRERGVPATADMVGVQLPAGVEPVPGITWHGSIYKTGEDGQRRLAALYRSAAFFVLPTRQDCTPMVFAEANAFGVPCVTRDTGGVGSVVENGGNGLLLPETADATAFADAIERLWKDRPAYLALRRSARAAYETRLNWTAWAAAMRQVIDGLVARGIV